MSFAPGYGETPLDGDELGALLPGAKELLGGAPTRAGVYDLEQAVQEQVIEDLLPPVLGGELGVGDMATDHFVRELHGQLYGDIWTWGGQIRRRELNLGAAPELIHEE